MTREEFIEYITEQGGSCEIRDGGIIVEKYKNGRGDIDIIILDRMETIPEGVIFRNFGGVALVGIDRIPPNTIFANNGSVTIENLKVLEEGVKFWNNGSVFLPSIKMISPRFIFNNRLWISLGKYYKTRDWVGNIMEINSGRLTHLMIKRGIFNDKTS